MSDESPRARRLADRIKVIVAEMIEMKIKDPRLGFVTVTDAYVTNDLREATVFYTVLGDALERAMKQANANCAMRHELVSKGEALTAQKAAARFAHMQRARAAARYAPGVEFAAKLARKLKSL